MLTTVLTLKNMLSLFLYLFILLLCFYTPPEPDSVVYLNIKVTPVHNYSSFTIHSSGAFASALLSPVISPPQIEKSGTGDLSLGIYQASNKSMLTFLHNYKMDSRSVLLFCSPTSTAALHYQTLGTGKGERR